MTTKIPSNEYDKKNSRVVEPKTTDAEVSESKGLEHPAHISEKRVGSLSVIHLHIDDPLVSQRGTSVVGPVVKFTQIQSKK